MSFKNWEYEKLTEADYKRIGEAAKEKSAELLDRQMKASRIVLYTMVGGGPLGKSVQEWCQCATGDMIRFTSIVPMRYQLGAVDQYCALLKYIAKVTGYDLMKNRVPTEWIFPGDDFYKDDAEFDKLMSFYHPITADNLWQAQIILYTLVGGGILGQTALYQPDDFYIDGRAATPGMVSDCEAFCKRYAEVCKTLDKIPERWPIFGGGVFT